jgi:hypothetical protein
MMVFEKNDLFLSLSLSLSLSQLTTVTGSTSTLKNGNPYSNVNTGPFKGIFSSSCLTHM